MARRNIKKVTSRRRELLGIRFREGSCKCTVELRLPGRKEKFWRVVDNLDEAKRLVELVRAYTKGEKAFPPDHPDLPRLEAFCKNEFEGFIWEEFQRNYATELLEDPTHGLDDEKTEEATMPTNAPEPGSVDSEVGTCGGDAQVITLGCLCTLQNVVRLAQEKLQDVQGMLQDVVGKLQAAEEMFKAANLRCEALAHRTAREGYVALLGNGGLGAPPSAPAIFEVGPSNTNGFAHLDEIGELDAAPVLLHVKVHCMRGGFAPTLENGVLGSPSPALTAFEVGLSDTRGFAHMFAFAELDAQPTPVLLEASALYARGSIASPEHDDWSGEIFNFDEFYANAS